MAVKTDTTKTVADSVMRQGVIGTTSVIAMNSQRPFTPLKMQQVNTTIALLTGIQNEVQNTPFSKLRVNSNLLYRIAAQDYAQAMWSKRIIFWRSEKMVEMDALSTYTSITKRF